MSHSSVTSGATSRSSVVPVNAAGRPAVGDVSIFPGRLMRRVIAYLGSPEDMLALSQTCWCMFVLLNEESFWQTVCLRPPLIDPALKRAHWRFQGSWKQTALHPQPSQRHRRQEESRALYDAPLATVNEQFRAEEAARAVRAAKTHPGNEIAVRLSLYLAASACDSRCADTDGRSCDRTHVRSSEQWSIAVVGKPYCPGLSTRFLSMAHGAVNYLNPRGALCLPPPYALHYGVSRREMGMYKLHNVLGESVLDVVPLLPPYSAASFYATWNYKMAFVDARRTDPERVYVPLIPPSVSPSSSPSPSVIYDEQIGVPGVVDRRYRLSLEAFQREYESTNTPVVLTGCIDHWPARSRWLGTSFCEHYGEAWVKPNGRSADGRRFRLRARDFFAYARSTNGEKPMYVFDKKILAKESGLRRDYDIPPYFREDYFSVMAEEDRPDYRWLLIGPDGSGTPYHTDPHASSAWNTVLDGVKRFSLYHPDVIPPGVDAALVNTEYYASQPYMEWYRRTLPELVKQQASSPRGSHSGLGDGGTAVPSRPGYSATSLPLEALVFPGDIVFVPSEWWHQTINYGLTIAVTQNVCSRFTFPRVAKDMNAHAGRGVRQDFAEALNKAGYAELAKAIVVPPPPPAKKPKRQRSDGESEDETSESDSSNSSSSEPDSDDCDAI